jgi:hypothetical protein
MNAWDRLTLEQYSVMICALEEALLDNVLDEYGMRLRHAKTGDPRLPSKLTDEDKAELVPHFAPVVFEMFRAGWIEIRETPNMNWDEGTSIIEEEMSGVLNDPEVWIKGPEGSRRMVMILRTGIWDDLVASQSESGNGS